jgi:hypothetical protein
MRLERPTDDEVGGWDSEASHCCNQDLFGNLRLQYPTLKLEEAATETYVVIVLSDFQL